MPSTATRPHAWKFFRSGGFDQVRIETADDLRHLDELDQKLWAVLTCPIAGLECDARTLALMDTDGEGRVRATELLDAVRWTCRMLADPQIVFDGGARLPLAALRADDPEASQLRATAAEVLALLGRPDDDAIGPEDLSDRERLFQPVNLNGDGIVPRELAGDDTALAEAIDLIVRCKPGPVDRSGQPGVDAATLQAFFDDVRAVVAWHDQADSAGDAVLALGADTAAAVAAFDAVRAKVEDFFTRCELAAFDAQAGVALNPAEATYTALAGATLSPADDALAALPVARVAAGASLPLGGALNPAWVARMRALSEQVVAPLMGPREGLTHAEWDALAARLDAWRQWQAAQPATPVADEPVQALRTLRDANVEGRLQALLERDAAASTAAGHLEALERLVLYRRDLATLLRNYVNLEDFYTPGRKAIFQAGTLYLDQRSCELCLLVADMDRHAAMAPLSGTFLLYCECTREGEAPMTIVAGLTGGEADDMLVPGRHGVFYDRQGRDWHARVLKIVEAPISVRQAFWSPYRRVGKLIGDQIRKFAAAQDKNVEAKAGTSLAAASSNVTAAAAAPKAAPPAVAKAGAAGMPAGAKAAVAKSAAGPAPAAAAPAAPPPVDMARYAGIFAAIGLALGAMGTAIAAIVGAFLSLPAWEMPLVILGAMLVISGPSMILAWLKLRRRNLGPLLDANGWAVNIRARINISFGASLTGVAALPAGASRTLVDPFEDKRFAWGRWILLGVVVAAGAWWALVY